MLDISIETIKQAASGSMPAFEEIYNKTSGFVYNVALRTLGTKEDAEEVTQDVFVTIHRKLDSYRFESSLKTWVYRITVNLAINYLKKRARHRNKTVSYEDSIQVAERIEDPNKIKDQSLASGREEVLKKMLDALNPEQKTSIILRNFQGLSYQEIADTLKININTVRSRLKRAREKLIALRSEMTKNEL